MRWFRHFCVADMALWRVLHCLHWQFGYLMHLAWESDTQGYLCLVAFATAKSEVAQGDFTNVLYTTSPLPPQQGVPSCVPVVLL